MKNSTIDYNFSRGDGVNELINVLLFKHRIISIVLVLGYVLVQYHDIRTTFQPFSIHLQCRALYSLSTSIYSHNKTLTAFKTDMRKT